jgi:hypothetical protein
MHNPVDRYIWKQENADRLRQSRNGVTCYELTKRLRVKLPKLGVNRLKDFDRCRVRTMPSKLLEVICEELETTVDFILYGKNSKAMTLVHEYFNDWTKVNCRQEPNPPEDTELMVAFDENMEIYVFWKPYKLTRKGVRRGRYTDKNDVPIKDSSSVKAWRVRQASDDDWINSLQVITKNDSN